MKTENERRLIFMDGEFCDLVATGVKLLSIALVNDKKDTPEDEALYVEFEYNKEDCSQWVLDNVIPRLNGQKVSLEAAKKEITDFVTKHYGTEKPVLVADVNQFDWNAICHLFGVWDIPFFYIPLDLSSILFAKGYDIDISREKLCAYLKCGTDKPDNKHNALYDAIQCRNLFYTIMKFTTFAEMLNNK